jgi:hypothetical protein
MKWRKILPCICLVALLFVSFSVNAETTPFDERSGVGKSCIVASSAVASVPYFTSKMLYCLGGNLVAGGINLFSLGFAQDTATEVGTQAINGDWYVHPRVLTREQPLVFVGKTEPVEIPTLTMHQN